MELSGDNTVDTQVLSDEELSSYPIWKIRLALKVLELQKSGGVKIPEEEKKEKETGDS